MAHVTSEGHGSEKRSSVVAAEAVGSTSSRSTRAGTGTSTKTGVRECRTVMFLWVRCREVRVSCSCDS